MNCFAPIDRTKFPLPKPIEYEKTRKTWSLIPYAVKVGEVNGEETNVIRYKPVLTEEVDIQEYIHSFSDDVGIQNILKKVALTGDKSYLNQTHREPLNPDGGLEPVQDYTNVPKNKTEAFNAVAAGVAAFDELPADLKGKMSMQQFAELVGQEQFDAYIQSVVAKMQPAKTDGDNK